MSSTERKSSGLALSCVARSAAARDAYSAVGASTTTKVEPKCPGKVFSNSASRLRQSSSGEINLLMSVLIAKCRAAYTADPNAPSSAKTMIGQGNRVQSLTIPVTTVASILDVAFRLQGSHPHLHFGAILSILSVRNFCTRHRLTLTERLRGRDGKAHIGREQIISKGLTNSTSASE